ncbi:MAG: hypothetical protein EHM25_01640 [Nitrosopumilales archaeon]|nr:MAG: hypothetical protein EHM25_01640 [Nitrosopumilales archaeon]
MATAKKNAEQTEEKMLTLQERIALHKAQETNDEYASEGTLDDYLGDGGIMEFNPRNLKRADKDVLIDLYPHDFKAGDEVKRIFLGRGLSAEFRAKRVSADNLLSMEISRRLADDVCFITLERAEGLFVSTTQLDITKEMTKETFNINELIAYGA